MDIFPLLTTKDSALVKVPTDSVFLPVTKNRARRFYLKAAV
jgi:hypothetical protein